MLTGRQLQGLHQLLAQTAPPRVFAHQQFLHLGAVQAISLLAQVQLHAGLHLFVLTTTHSNTLPLPRLS